eukprot:COSAG02_NODE_919_length_15936_cov_5.055314_7_plen_222_part_00
MTSLRIGSARVLGAGVPQMSGSRSALTNLDMCDGTKPQDFHTISVGRKRLVLAIDTPARIAIGRQGGGRIATTHFPVSQIKCTLNHKSRTCLSCLKSLLGCSTRPADRRHPVPAFELPRFGLALESAPPQPHPELWPPALLRTLPSSAECERRVRTSKHQGKHPHQKAANYVRSLRGNAAAARARESALPALAGARLLSVQMAKGREPTSMSFVMSVWQPM